MTFKFDHNTLMTIAGENTPEKIAQRLLKAKKAYNSCEVEIGRYLREAIELGYDKAYNEEKMLQRTEKRAILARLIAEDEERLMVHVLHHETRLG